ncbi:small multidrug resistance pump [Variovorax sp. YR750]|nr:small multidrug resistance pump [Variovorax sp. NFACC28]SEG81849.1 small multidrug resistance pump [Variovorax sp. NFACC29]SEL64441.1 small multidrug resistance pump [Variovorax sp. YR750]SFD09519.1 small multidrug resistance pump [Variovorax sp. NFACC26]SFG18484.1 small multidrug resistance pump [Variovorax sp. NFACC27]
MHSPPGTAGSAVRYSVSPQTLAWLLLAASVAAEVAGTMALRFAEGFTRLVPSVVTGACYAAAIWLMSLAVRELGVGLSYAVWAGSGTVLIAVLGMIWLGEPVTLPRIAGVAAIVAGVIVLNLEAR